MLNYAAKICITINTYMLNCLFEFTNNGDGSGKIEELR
jgi:hypothetical protein